MLTAPPFVPPRKPQPEPKREKEAKKPTIKKPLNAFMLYMKEMRAKVIAECTLKESAAINQILGRRVRAHRAQCHHLVPHPCPLQLLLRTLQASASNPDALIPWLDMSWGGVAVVGRAGRGQQGRASLLFVLAVARAVPRGTGQVLRTGSQGTAAPHAALPRLVCQRQLRECHCARTPTLWHGPKWPGGLAGVYQHLVLETPFLAAQEP